MGRELLLLLFLLLIVVVDCWCWRRAHIFLSIFSDAKLFLRSASLSLLSSSSLLTAAIDGKQYFAQLQTSYLLLLRARFSCAANHPLSEILRTKNLDFKAVNLYQAFVNITKLCFGLNLEIKISSHKVTRQEWDILKKVFEYISALKSSIVCNRYMCQLRHQNKHFGLHHYVKI